MSITQFHFFPKGCHWDNTPQFMACPRVKSYSHATFRFKTLTETV
jgi:hypothetical protein